MKIRGTIVILIMGLLMFTGCEKKKVDEIETEQQKQEPVLETKEEARAYARYLIAKDKDNEVYPQDVCNYNDNEHSDFNFVLYQEYDWQEYEKKKELSDEDELLSRGNYIRDSVVAQNDMWLSYLGWDGITRIPVDQRFDDVTLISKEKGINLTTYQDYLYYETNNTICRMKFDGSGQEYLANGEFSQIYDDWIYFTTHGEYNAIWKMKMDGTGLKLIYNQEVSNLIYDNGKLYFAKGNLIHWAYADFYQINTRVFTDGMVRMFTVNDSSIIWYDGEKLYRGSISGEEGNILLDDVEIRNLFTIANDLYYAQYDAPLEQSVLQQLTSISNYPRSICVLPPVTSVYE